MDVGGWEWVTLGLDGYLCGRNGFGSVAIIWNDGC